MTAPSTPAETTASSATEVQLTESATTQRATTGTVRITSYVHQQLDDDFITERGVRNYLDGTRFASTKVEMLSGGMVNFVYRLWLVTPYQGRKTLVFKHAKPYMKDFHDMHFAVERQIYEVEALKRVGSWIAADAIVTVPQVHQFDEKAHVIIMDDSGPGSTNLKEFMQKGGPSLRMAKEIGTLLGEFMGELHKWGNGNEDVCNFFDSNQDARSLTSRAYYGRLVQTLGGESGISKLENPPLTVSKEDERVVREVAEEAQKTVLETKDCFVMGDFWPGNLTVGLDENRELSKIYVLDWEAARPGLQGIEIGQFCAEIHLLRRFHEETCKGTSQLILDNFFKSYVKKVGRDAEVARRALVHWGTHIVSLAARVEWGDKEKTREVVVEGVKLIVQGYKADNLAESVVGELC